jgi:hypothetical protein
MRHRVRRRVEKLAGVIQPLMKVAYSTEFERIVSRYQSRLALASRLPVGKSTKQCRIAVNSQRPTQSCRADSTRSTPERSRPRRSLVHRRNVLLQLRDPIVLEHVSVGFDVILERRSVLGVVDRQGCVLGTGCCGADPGGGHVVTIVITNSGVPHHVVDNTAYNYHSLLRTMEEAFDLPHLTHAVDSFVTPVTDLFLVSRH